MRSGRAIQFKSSFLALISARTRTTSCFALLSSVSLRLVGEALGQAANEDEKLEELIPAIPRIVALRNRVIHGYDSVDDEIVWNIVQSDVPVLRSRLRDLLDEGGGEEKSGLG